MKNFKLVYSNEFMNSLKGTIEYIKIDSLEAAKIFERKLREKIGLLKQFPEMGKPSEDTRLRNIRILVVGNYLVLYEINSRKKLIYLHTFCHGARDYPSLFKNISKT